jgi:hypothetical protein
MSSPSEPAHLSSHHRDTLLQIFEEPTDHNIEWHDVLSLLNEVGTVEEPHGNMFRLQVGSESSVFTRREGKDIDAQQVVDLRLLLTGAGYDKMAADLKAKGKES